MDINQILDSTNPANSKSDSTQTMNRKIESIRELNNALHSGNTKAFSMEAKDKPIGTRYFVERPGKYETKTGEFVDTFSVVDNMKYGKTENGEIDLDNYGLLASTKELLNDIDPSYVMVEGFTERASANVEVEIETDASGKLENKFIPISEYKKLDCTAFKNKCKRYTGMEHCDTCEIKEQKPDLNNLLGGGANEEAINAAAASAANAEVDKVLSKLPAPSANVDFAAEAGLDGFTTMEDDMKQPFFQRYSQPLNNFQTVGVGGHSGTNEINFIVESNPNKYDRSELLVIEKDVATTLWVGGITLVGLFVLSRYL
jgi:hypothetical protein